MRVCGNDRMKRIVAVSIALIALMPSGCGTAVTGDFSNRLLGADGQLFVLEDLERIARDPDLDDTEKRDLFRDLGIEDEGLIDALLDL